MIDVLSPEKWKGGGFWSSRMMFRGRDRGRRENFRVVGWCPEEGRKEGGRISDGVPRKEGREVG